MSSPADSSSTSPKPSSERKVRGSRLAAEATAELRIDRIACTGHGVCAGVLPRHIELDEWGYPIVTDPVVSAGDAALVIKLCPAMAIYRAPVKATARRGSGRSGAR